MDTWTVDDLLRDAQTCITLGEAHLHQAAEDIHAASEKGATQRTIAEAVGKSASWVNGLLQWRLGGYDGTAFGPQSAKNRERIKSEKQETPEEADAEPVKPNSKREGKTDPPNGEKKTAGADEKAAKGKAHKADQRAKAKQKRDTDARLAEAFRIGQITRSARQVLGPSQFRACGRTR
jgi:hypothetical protein